MFRISPRAQDIALDCTLYATAAAASITVAKAVVSITSTSSLVNRVAGYVMATAFVMGSATYPVLILRLPFLFKESSIRTVRLTFFGIGTIATAIISSIALRFFTGSFAPWSIYGLGLQAGISIAAGMLYKRLVNRWAVFAIAGDQQTPENIRGIVRDTDAKLNYDVWHGCHLKFWEQIPVPDEYGQRSDVTPDEVAECFEYLLPHNGQRPWDKGALSEVTLGKLLSSKFSPFLRSKLLNLTFNDSDRQIQILQQLPLDESYIGFNGGWSNSNWEYPKLSNETKTHLLKKPSIWDLVVIHQNELENKLDDIDDNELLKLDNLSFLHSHWSTSPIKFVIDCLSAKRVEILLSKLLEKKSAWVYDTFLYVLCTKKHPRQANIVPLLRRFASEAKESSCVKYLFECADEIRAPLLYKITLADQYCQSEDVTADMAAAVFEKCNGIRFQNARKWYEGSLSESTLTKMVDYLKTHHNTELLHKLMGLTYFEPQKQLQILQKLPLGHIYTNIDSFPINCPALAKETIDELLVQNKTPTSLELVIYAHNGDVHNRLAFIDELGQREDVTTEALYQYFTSAIQSDFFWNCPTRDLGHLSVTTLDKLSMMPSPHQVGFRECLLHLMREHQERQIQFLDKHPFGAYHRYHSKDPIHDHTRFHYAALHKDTITNLMKKNPPTVWDLAYCARQDMNIRAKLSEASMDDLAQIADFQGGVGGCAASPRKCWDNFRCWDSSLVKFVAESLSGDKQAQFIEALNKTFWFMFVAPRFFSQVTPVIPNNHSFSYLYFERLVERLALSGTLPPDFRSHLTPRELCYETIKAETEQPNFLSKLGFDVFKKICRMLYPADRAHLAGTCARSYIWIGTDKGALIWDDTGSIGAARNLQKLSNTLEVMRRLTGTDIEITTTLALALMWPKNFWPRSEEPEWFMDAYTKAQLLQ